MTKLIVTAFFVLLPFAHSAEEPAPKPKFFERLWKSTKSGAGRTWDTTKKIGGKTVDVVKSPFNRGKRSDPEAKAGWKKLAMTMLIEPPSVKIGETRVLDLTIAVVNKGKDPVQLDFPNSQRIEVLVMNESGRVLSKWSEDQRIDKEPGFVLINPAERIEYFAKISTREMKESKPFTIEASFAGYNQLRASRVLVPRR